jgi:CRISPR-associated protein Cmr2
MDKKVSRSVQNAIAWCLAWGGDRLPQYPEVIQQMRGAVGGDNPLPDSAQPFLAQAQQLNDLEFPETAAALKELAQKHEDLWNAKIGLVYGGATKIKQYVFEAAKLPDIRGASALLDRINLVDLPAFFHCELDEDNYPQCAKAKDYCQKNVREQWLDIEFPNLSGALIPELIIYSTGGNILAFCPAAFVDILANAIEKRYTHETLTANSCAVGNTFRLLEIRFGCLQEKIEQTFWLKDYTQNLNHPLTQAYFAQPDTDSEQAFKNRKSFNELVGKLATLFNQRRNGNDFGVDRPSRRYPPMFETHPYLRRDEGDHRSALVHAKTDSNNPSEGLPGSPYFSEASARKRLIGQVAKREYSRNELPRWYQKSGLSWHPGDVESWVSKFEQFLVNPSNHSLISQYDPDQHIFVNGQLPQNQYGREARSVREIADASTPKGFVAYIYADGNNMGGYIQTIQTPLEYYKFSRDIFEATEQSVYKALAQLHPHYFEPDESSGRRESAWVHPFEILTIGGDDVMIVVPADKALAIAKTIGHEFECILKQKGYTTDKTYQPENIHRYKGENIPSGTDQCKLSMSIGVLMTAEDTPIYYAENLTSQLLKSAKKRAKDLKNKQRSEDLEKDHYYGGTVDFLIMKSVTMISSNIAEFRNQGLTQVKPGLPKLKLYGAPYTLHELGGLLDTAKVLKASKFPRSQLYQIRSLLDKGKRTAMLNYRYFRTRLNNKDAKQQLEQQFEKAWCEPKDSKNTGNLAPWMSLQEIDSNATTEQQQKMTYETIWYELVELYPFIEEPQDDKDEGNTSKIHTQETGEIMGV